MQYIPLLVADQIGRHCPRALTTYVLCLGRMNDNAQIVFSKKEICRDLSESFTKFRNDLKALAREGLLEWSELGEYIQVVMLSTDDDL